MKRFFLALATGLCAISLTVSVPGSALAHGCCKKEAQCEGCAKAAKACAACVKNCEGCRQEGKQHTCKDCKHKKPAQPAGQK